MAKAVNTNLEFIKFGNKQITCRVHHAERWLDESQAKIKIAGRNVNNLGYADDTTLIAESKKELKGILKSRDITLLTKVHLIKAMVFPVVMYACESWTVKKAEH